MDTLLWIVLVVAVLVALVGLFAFFRRKQRSGDVVASRPAGNTGSTP